MTTPELRIAITEAMDAEWEKHAQQIGLNVPGGAGSQRTVDGGRAMSRIGFNLAVMAIVDRIEEQTA